MNDQLDRDPPPSDGTRLRSTGAGLPTPTFDAAPT
jgi:hypothetical protein